MIVWFENFQALAKMGATVFRSSNPRIRCAPDGLKLSVKPNNTPVIRRRQCSCPAMEAIFLVPPNETAKA
jgi:hypothetical protein